MSPSFVAVAAVREPTKSFGDSELAKLKMSEVSEVEVRSPMRNLERMVENHRESRKEENIRHSPSTERKTSTDFLECA